MIRKLVICSFVVLIASVSFAAPKEEPKEVYYIVAHGGITNPFWQRTLKGAEDAGKELGVEVHFQAPEQYDVKEMVDMLDTVIARKPTGIASTLSVPEMTDEPLRTAAKNGIPVVLLDADDNRPDPIPHIAFVGWNAYGIGTQSADKIIDELGKKPKHVLIGVHEAGNIALEARAQGLIDVLTKRLGSSVKIDKLLTTVDMAKAMSAYDSFLAAHPDVDLIFATGSASGDPAIKFLEEKNLQGKITLVTADLSEQILGGIERGTVAFTSDCQQYLWGYLPVVYLHLYHKYGMRPVSPTFTGPSIIDKSNLESVKALVSEGIR
jgi:simple sugar transport system substrate-binding protein